MGLSKHVNKKGLDQSLKYNDIAVRSQELEMMGIIRSPYDATVRLMMASLERNLLPDAVIRRIIRLHLADRLRSGYKASSELQLSDLLRFVHELREMPIAINTHNPNPNKAQHYEVPTSFFKLVLGEKLKNSCCYYSDKSATLEDAEKAMLEMYCDMSKLKDGHTVLDIGCGWGSLSLYIAQKYMNCKITGITNSKSQKAYIDEQCRVLEIQNVEIILADVSSFEMEASYDRIYSISMFEIMKNYRDLLKKISKWMKEDALLFIEHFCHKAFAYHIEAINEHDWLTKTFFNGVTMPSANLLLYFQDDVSVVDHWLLNGKHFAQTSDEYVKRMDKNSASIKPIIESIYGKEQAVKWTAYWRTFFIAYAELFRYNNGEEWMFAHLLFKKK